MFRSTATISGCIEVSVATCDTKWCFSGVNCQGNWCRISRHWINRGILGGAICARRWYDPIWNSCWHFNHAFHSYLSVVDKRLPFCVNLRTNIPTLAFHLSVILRRRYTQPSSTAVQGGKCTYRHPTRASMGEHSTGATPSMHLLHLYQRFIPVWILWVCGYFFFTWFKVSVGLAGVTLYLEAVSWTAMRCVQFGILCWDCVMNKKISHSSESCWALSCTTVWCPICPATTTKICGTTPPGWSLWDSAFPKLVYFAYSYLTIHLYWVVVQVHVVLSLVQDDRFTTRSLIMHHPYASEDPSNCPSGSTDG